MGILYTSVPYNVGTNSSGSSLRVLVLGKLSRDVSTNFLTFSLIQ